MRKLISLLLTLCLLAVSAAALADTAITVSGTGNAYVAADTAVISLGVNARDKDVLKAQAAVNEAIAAVRAALEEKGVAKEDINTDYINIYAIYDYQNDMEQIVAYNANSTLAIRVTDMESVGSLIDTAFTAGANTLNGIDFSASDTAAARAEALKAAVADAKAKAEALAEATGLKVKELKAIEEGGTYSYANSRGFETKEMAAAADYGTVVQSARLVVSATITVTYEAGE
jgi:uncharacterized protein YggE